MPDMALLHPASISPFSDRILCPREKRDPVAGDPQGRGALWQTGSRCAHRGRPHSARLTLSNTGSELVLCARTPIPRGLTWCLHSWPPERHACGSAQCPHVTPGPRTSGPGAVSIRTWARPAPGGPGRTGSRPRARAQLGAVSCLSDPGGPSGRDRRRPTGPPEIPSRGEGKGGE